MESHQIPDTALTASSERIYYLRASQGRLRMRSFYPWLPAGWSAAVSNKNQWFEINLTVKTKVTRIATQGLDSRWSPDQWVTSYQVSYKGDGHSQWVFYKQSRQVKVFDASQLNIGGFVVNNKSTQVHIYHPDAPGLWALSFRIGGRELNVLNDFIILWHYKSSA